MMADEKKMPRKTYEATTKGRTAATAPTKAPTAKPSNGLNEDGLVPGAEVSFEQMVAANARRAKKG